MGNQATPATDSAEHGSDGMVIVLNYNWDVRNRLTEEIRDLGFDCHGPRSDALNLEQLSQWSPWLIFAAEFILESETGELLLEWKHSEAGRSCHIISILDNFDEGTINKCIRMGCDDVMPRSYTLALLRMRLQSATHMHRLYREQQLNHQQTLKISRELQQDMQSARQIFKRLTRDSEQDDGHYKTLRKSLEVISGDIIFTHNHPSGVQYFLIGDMTGHGLPAALEAMLTHDTFKAMTGKGYSLIEVAAELNRKLAEHCPTGRFLSCALLELNPFNLELGVINAGLPDILVLRQDAPILRIQSQNLPLGIVEESEFSQEYHRLSIGDRIYAYSDGLIEMEDASGNTVGQETLEQLLAGAFPTQSGLERVADWIRHLQQRDDISVLKISCHDPADLHAPSKQAAEQVGQRDEGHAMGWDLALTLDTEALRKSNPIPLLMNFILELHDLPGHQESLYMLITEMYSNALEHGILGLESQTKLTGSGFADYYQQRMDRLNQLEAGEIRIAIRHHQSSDHRYLTLRMQDSGEGYDVASTLDKTTEDEQLFSRGLKLICELSESVSLNAAGNCIEARYRLT